MAGAPPQLALSTGPAVAEAGGSGYGSTGTGAFYFKQPPAPGLVASLAPWVVVGVFAWVLIRK